MRATGSSAPRSSPSYLEFLSAGGSRPPEELGKLMGVDLTDPGFWASGLELVEAQVRAVEELADQTIG